MIAAFYHPGYVTPLGDHIMPINKFTLVAERVAAMPGIRLEEPEPLLLEDLLRVHTADYVDAVRTGEPRALAESQKFPWSSQLFPSVLLTGGGCLASARRAMSAGIAAAIVSGFHHSHADHGEGFCTFNSLVVAADRLHLDGLVQRVAVLDMDLHYGNGTASLAVDRPYLFNMSIYGNDYCRNTPYRDVSERHHVDGENHRSIALPNGSGRARMLDALEEGFRQILEYGRPDLLLYQAGADPYREDPYSPLDLGLGDLRDRDRRVFELAKQHAIPIAWVLAGGYTKDVTKIVEVHVNTFAAAVEVYGA